MGEEPRCAIRRGAVELTRRQWIFLGCVLFVGIVLGLVLTTTVSLAAGGIVLGLTGLVTTLTANAVGRRP